MTHDQLYLNEWYSLEEDRFYTKNLTRTMSITQKPLTLCIHVGYKCNLTCSYCLSKDDHDQFNAKDIEIEKIYNFIKKEAIPRVIISGGEPFLYKDRLWALLRGLKKSGCYTFVSTNGTIGKEIEHYYLDTIDWFDISLPATERALYHKIRGKDYFEKVIEFIQTLHSKGKRLRLSYTLNEDNLSDVFKLPQFAMKLGINNIRISHTYVEGQNLIWDTKRNADLKRMFTEENNNFILYMPLTPDKLKEYETGYLVLQPDGKLYRCNTQKENFLFSINDQDWESKEKVLIDISKSQAKLFYRLQK